MQNPGPYALSRRDNSGVLIDVLTYTSVPYRNHVRSTWGPERRRTRADVVGSNLYTFKQTSLTDIQKYIDISQRIENPACTPWRTGGALIWEIRAVLPLDI